MNTSDLKRCCNTGGDERGGNKILSHSGIKVEGPTSNCQRWRDDGSDHGQGVLEAEKDGQENWDLIIEAVEGRLVVFVFAIEWPDVGGDEVEVILS